MTVGLLKNPVNKKITCDFRPESGLKFSLRHFFNSPTVPSLHQFVAHLEKKADSVGLFDCICLDVPCSNTGVLAKRPEVRHRISKSAVENLARIQFGLLETSAEMLKPDGRICYSTCSIVPQENGLIIRRFLEGNPAFKVKAEKLILPSAEDFDHDGAYTAVIGRNSD